MTCRLSTVVFTLTMGVWIIKGGLATINPEFTMGSGGTLTGLTDSFGATFVGPVTVASLGLMSASVLSILIIRQRQLVQASPHNV